MSTPLAGMAAYPQAQGLAERSLRSERLFYVISASITFILTAVGFRFFILHGKGFGGGEMTSQIVQLIVVHGLAMFTWVSFFLVQSLLVLAGNRRLHMRIGPAAAVLAALIVILGTTVAGLSAHFNQPLYVPFGGARLFLATMWSEMLSFGVLVAIGITYRYRMEIHRPMMLLATVMISSGALARFPYISDIAVRPPLYVHGPVLLFGALLFLLQWAITKAANRWYAIGYAGLVNYGPRFRHRGPQRPMVSSRCKNRSINRRAQSLRRRFWIAVA